MWKVSDILVKHIKAAEGYRSQAYLCPAGRYTCGYGHTRGVTRLTTCTEARAEAWLRDDLQPVENFVNAIHNVNTQGRFDALVDFGFNVGLGNMRSSTLLKLIQRGASDKEICREFEKWVYAGGKVLSGLVDRRGWEAQRWCET